MKRLLLGITSLWLGLFFILALLFFLDSAPKRVNAIDYVVTNLADSGAGSLREAINLATADDRITFDPVVFPPNNPQTIFVQSPLPTLDDAGVDVDASDAGVIIDGSQAPEGTNGFIIYNNSIAITGLVIQNFSSNGIIIESGNNNNRIGGDRSIGSAPNGQGNTIINNGGNGVDIRGSLTENNRIFGNNIGIDQTGMWGAGNANNGVAISQNASNNLIGHANSNLRNIISGNVQNGIWIGESNQNVIVGNFIGTRSNGLEAVPNLLSGISLQNGSQNNLIGGELINGEMNLISGNGDHGIYIGGEGSDNNEILGNIIGLDQHGTGYIGQGTNGILITEGASNNRIGSNNLIERNIISRNSKDGIQIEKNETLGNIVQGNYIGSDIDGAKAQPNGEHGIELSEATHNNIIGGNRLSGEGNLLSGNANHGLVLSLGAYNNIVSGNLVGPDVTGNFSLGNQPFGGIDISSGARDNIIGGDILEEGNVISGNRLDGIAIFDDEENTRTVNNQIKNNIIGLNSSGSSALPNEGFGIYHVLGASGTTIIGNTVSGNTADGILISGITSSNNILQSNMIGTSVDGNSPIGNGESGVKIVESAHNNLVGNNNIIAFNARYGVEVGSCNSNIITQNSIYSNISKDISSNCHPAPQLTPITEAIIHGSTTPNAQIEYFSDDEDGGRMYEGQVIANENGDFTLAGFTGPNVTATSTDSNGNTSSFSYPAHTLWTFLLYLNGDNDLEKAIFETIDGIATSGASPRANVIALVDGYSSSSGAADTYLYELTRGQKTSITTTLGISNTVPGELNMGDGQTLIDFVNWGKTNYPAQHIFLSIVDHGGGWAPSTTEPLTNTLPSHRQDFLAGNSGLSWDFSNEYDYLNNKELRHALTIISNDSADPIDVISYDVCLMGLAEVAYELKAQANFFISSQNIGWAPIGENGRYIQAIHGIEPTATPQQLSELFVQSYASSLPPDGHPFTVSAVDLSWQDQLANDVNLLADALIQQLEGSNATHTAQSLYLAYIDTQKLDYDSDFIIEAETDGFVDLYDFTLKIEQHFDDPSVLVHAQELRNTLDSAIVAEAHQGGNPWPLPDQEWDYSGINGLSIFLPLGEDLELPIVITETSPITPSLEITRNLRLRDLYSSDQLQFVEDTLWGTLIETYYDVSSVPSDVNEDPVASLLPPDLTPPTTTIGISGQQVFGEQITITWSAIDNQSGVISATLWHKPPNDPWTNTGLTQSGDSGAFFFTLSERCQQKFAVRATDAVGNVEDIENEANFVPIVAVQCKKHLPIVHK